MNVSDLDQVNVEALSKKLEEKSPPDILAWAIKTFWPAIAMTSSFQTQSVPLLHMVAQLEPQLPIFFLDTGFHFPETLAFRDQLIQEFDLNVQVLRSDLEHDSFIQKYGNLYRHDPDLCCYINKVEPLQRAMQNLQAWISGIRRDQTAQRGDTPILARQTNGRYKICPLATWTRRELWQYLYDYDLPEHPLLAQGYLSIGCMPCTLPVGDGEDERSGRWNGRKKTECGLHSGPQLKD